MTRERDGGRTEGVAQDEKFQQRMLAVNDKSPQKKAQQDMLAVYNVDKK